MTAPRIVVAGGGFAGATLAVHLMRRASDPVQIDVVEPRDTLGAGLAYGTGDPEHRLNVPSDKMVVLHDDPLAFTRWMEATGRRGADPEGEDGTGFHYSRRVDFGAFMADLVRRTAVRAAPEVRVAHVRDRVTAVTPSPDGADATLASRPRLRAARVVLAMSHDRPALPFAVTPEVAHHPDYHADPWDTARISRIDSAARVVVLGTGLTMVDVVTGLIARGHHGPIVALSRRGLTPRGHGQFDPAVAAPPASMTATPLSALRATRRLVRDEVAAGRDWHPAVEAMRRSAEPIWQSWSARDQAHALRRLRAFWDVHRFRIAPQVADRLDATRGAGALDILRAGVEGLALRDGGFEVSVRTAAGPAQHAADVVVNCLGPRPDITRRADPVLRQLLAGGIAVPDPHRLGLDVDAAYRLRGADGTVSTAVRAVGPLTRGVFWEVVGVPELSAHCDRLAAALLSERAMRPTVSA